MRSGFGAGGKKKGFAITTIAIIGFVFILVFLVAGLFSGGGSHSDTLLGWGGVPLLAGIDSFITGIYNLFIYLSLWVTIGLLGVILLGVQVGLLFFYYKVLSYMWSFKDAIKNIIDELLDI